MVKHELCRLFLLRALLKCRSPPSLLTFDFKLSNSETEEKQMAFYYAKEKRDFDREWDKLRAEYRSAGMPERSIDALYQFDLKWFCSRRRFSNHNQSLPSEVIDNEDDYTQSSLIRKFASFAVDLDETLIGGRYGWIESVEDEQLLDKLKRLSQDDLELLTLVAIDGYSQIGRAHV